MAYDQSSLPIDAVSAARLAEDGLRMALVDTADRAQFEPWVQAAKRGFHQGQLDKESADEMMAAFAACRTTGVWDDAAADPHTPVATVDSFTSPLTVPGQREVSASAISVVTVAPTHRRRGIARELLESELRTAVALDIPVAMLTVSESTIYSRFGFAPAAMASDLRIDTRRAQWRGPTPAGRVQFVPLEQLRGQVEALYETARVATPGEIELRLRQWDEILNLTEEHKDVAKRARAVRYDDADGTPQGFAIVKMRVNDADFTAHTAEVEYLLANTPDAYAALWRFVIELDLTATVTARLRPVDEPLRWQLGDFRAVTATSYDHLWLRILDVPAALAARSYFAPADLVIEVVDEHGYTSGRYSLTVGDETATRVEPVETQPALTLGINELSALYLGGVSALTLQHAGRITEHLPGSVQALNAAFRSPVTPWLSTWF